MKVNHTPSQSLRLLPLWVALLFSPDSALAGPPKCFMHGIITPTDGRSEKPAISDMIRLHFDADTKAKCETLMKAYCQHNVREKKYSPTRLKGSFKPDTDKTEEYSYGFDSKCKLLTEED